MIAVFLAKLPTRCAPDCRKPGAWLGRLARQGVATRALAAPVVQTG